MGVCVLGTGDGASRILREVDAVLLGSTDGLGGSVRRHLFIGFSVTGVPSVAGSAPLLSSSSRS